ncbi:MAG TPA: hypothetical protein VG497_11665, partial [Kribbella sp.]|nr:hypothetical protein [Kribbella sp.]
MTSAVAGAAIVGGDVGSVFAEVVQARAIPAHRQVFGLVPNADMFPGTHGRQAMLGNSAPKALRLGDLVASGAFWWVTTAAVAILIA